MEIKVLRKNLKKKNSGHGFANDGAVEEITIVGVNMQETNFLCDLMKEKL